MANVDEVPEGFVRNERRSPLTDPWEPLWLRTQADSVQLGLRIAQAHCNARGFLHGGLIASLADNAMGMNVALAAQQGRGAVTVHLSVDYLRSGKIGQWLQIVPRVIRVGRSLGVVDALITADGETIARADATFRIGE